MNYDELEDYEQYLHSGYHIFPMHPILGGGQCGCGEPKCKAAGKHPRISNWQFITTWDEEQLSYMLGDTDYSQENQFASGFGVNISTMGLLVVDVDERNGGHEALAVLNDSLGLDLVEESGFVVRTGSGGQSRHIYFRLPQSYKGKALQGTLSMFKGIDFKSSGFVVGSGSNHVSGGIYRAVKGDPSKISDAPGELVDILVRPERMRSVVNGETHEYTLDELSGLVDAIPNTARDYEKWIRIGMALHHATNGEGFSLWLDWSSKNKEAHDESGMEMKWHSFGKNPQDQVTIGTLIMWAGEAGYVAPVEFECNDEELIRSLAELTTAKKDGTGVTDMQNVRSVNIKKPHGLVGEITRWINSRCHHPRETLSVAAALQIVSNAASLRYRVEHFNTSLNIITLGIADSGSGKGNVYDSLQFATRATGISAAAHGNIKSEQELVRNQTRHQAAFYMIDEIGALLLKIANASKGGRTPYLESVIAVLLELFSSANSSFMVSGDLKVEIQDSIRKELAGINKRMDAEGETEELKKIEEQLIKSLREVDFGLKNPIMTMYGVTEPIKYQQAIRSDPSLLTSGFIGRALIFTEQVGVPRRKKPSEFGSHDLPMQVEMNLKTMYQGGYAGDTTRVQLHGEKQIIKFDAQAMQAEEEIYEYWHEEAKKEEALGSGMHVLALRAPELTIKVAAILGVFSGVITLKDMQYAHALVLRNTHEKISLAKSLLGSESKDATERGNALLDGIKSLYIQDETAGFTVGIMRNKVGRKFSPEQTQEAVDALVKSGFLRKEVQHSSNNRKYERFYLNNA